MNFYIVVEGASCEKQVYTQWIQYLNPALSPVDDVSAVINNHFYVVGGGGYPNYFEVIRDAMEDVLIYPQFDRLVVAIDSEDESLADKYAEVDALFVDAAFAKPYRIIVQHFCLEAWALGNRVVFPRRPKNPRLAEYRRLHDVVRLDPELLPPLPGEDMNRAQFAEKYLRLMLNDRYRNLTYLKNDPKALLHNSYFEQLRNRLADTGHISSFNSFLTAFI